MVSEFYCISVPQVCDVRLLRAGDILQCRIAWLLAAVRPDDTPLVARHRVGVGVPKERPGVMHGAPVGVCIRGQLCLHGFADLVAVGFSGGYAHFGAPHRLGAVAVTIHVGPDGHRQRHLAGRDAA